ncbi:MAG TPA: hypothetical protein VF547_10010, partial [Allosphingosinicella sp.]
PAAGVLVLRLDGGGAALFGLLVEETHLVHGAGKAPRWARFPLFIVPIAPDRPHPGRRFLTYVYSSF